MAQRTQCILHIIASTPAFLGTRLCQCRPAALAPSPPHRQSQPQRVLPRALQQPHHAHPPLRWRLRRARLRGARAGLVTRDFGGPTGRQDPPSPRRYRRLALSPRCLAGAQPAARGSARRASEQGTAGAILWLATRLLRRWVAAECPEDVVDVKPGRVVVAEDVRVRCCGGCGSGEGLTLSAASRAGQARKELQGAPRGSDDVWSTHPAHAPPGRLGVAGVRQGLRQAPEGARRRR